MPESLTPFILPAGDPTGSTQAVHMAWTDSQNGCGLGDYRAYTDIKAWTGSPGYSTTASLVAGRLQLNKIFVRHATTLTTVNFSLANTPTLLTSGQNFISLFDSSGSRVALSADQTTAFGTSGLKSVGFTSPYSAAAGAYYVAILFNGTGVAPQMICHGAIGSSLMNFGFPSGEWRCIQSSGTYTAVPTSLTLSSQSTSAINYTAIIT